MYISTRFKIVLHLCGFLVLLYSLTMIPPMLIALFAKERSVFCLFFDLCSRLLWRFALLAGDASVEG
ncbi:Trk system potassium uptake protein trkG [Raoultella ornithinolytica]|nr:Trk system potassium uptake protein trkG [Raoultella ornithinolytica]